MLRLKGDAGLKKENGNILVAGMAMVFAIGVMFVMMKVDHYVVAPLRDKFGSGPEKENPAVVKKIRSERIRLFSDFSKPSAWPAADAAAMQKGIEKGQSRLFGELAQKENWTTAELDAAGAQTWGILAAIGTGAYNLLHDGNGELLQSRSKEIILAQQYLRKRCSQRVEVACLDLSKTVASDLFGGVTSFQNQAKVDNDALSQIPRELDSPEANELRARISSQAPRWKAIKQNPA